MTLGWPPTEKRGSIAADYGSPGPVYWLPPLTGADKHDISSRYVKGPAFNMGIRHKKFPDDSPGPVYRPNPRLTTQGMAYLPNFSIHSRPKQVKPYNTPGPGAYAPERAGPSAAKSNPQFTFGTAFKPPKNEIPGWYMMLWWTIDLILES